MICSSCWATDQEVFVESIRLNIIMLWIYCSLQYKDKGNVSIEQVSSSGMVLHKNILLLHSVKKANSSISEAVINDIRIDFFSMYLAKAG